MANKTALYWTYLSFLLKCKSAKKKQKKTKEKKEKSRIAKRISGPGDLKAPQSFIEDPSLINLVCMYGKSYNFPGKWKTKKTSGFRKFQVEMMVGV